MKIGGENVNANMKIISNSCEFHIHDVINIFDFPHWNRMCENKMTYIYLFSEPGPHMTRDGWQIITSPQPIVTNWDREGIILMSFCSCLIRYAGHSNQLPVSWKELKIKISSMHFGRLIPDGMFEAHYWDDGELIFVLMTPGRVMGWCPCQCPQCTGATFPAALTGAGLLLVCSGRQSTSGSLRDNSWPAELPASGSGYQPPEVFPDNTW